MKKLLKIVIWLGVIMLGLTLLVVVGLKLFFPLEKARTYTIEKGTELLGRQIAVGDVDISVWGGLGVQLLNVSIADDDEFAGEAERFLLEADDIDIKLQLLPLLSGAARVDRLIIDRPRIRLRKSASGSNNYTFEQLEKKVPREISESMTAETKAAAMAVSFDQLQINDGYLSYVDDSSGFNLELVGLNLSTILTNPGPGEYFSAGELSIESVKAVGDQPLPAYAVELQYRSIYDLNRSYLSVEEADLAINGVEFALSGFLSSPPGSLSSRFNLKSKRIVVGDLIQLLPPDLRERMSEYSLEGEFSLNADVEYDRSKAEPITYAGTASLTDVVASKKDNRGQLRLGRAIVDFKPDNLRLNIEEGSFDGSPLKGYLVVDEFERPVVSGELAGRMNLNYIEPLLPVEPGRELSGMASFDVSFSGPVSEPQKMKFSGNLTLDNGRYDSQLLPEPIESFTVDLYFDNKVASVKKLTGETASGFVDFKGRVGNLVAYLMADSLQALQIYPTVDGHLSGKLNLAMLNPFLPQAAHPGLSGAFTVDLSLAGSMQNPSEFQPFGTMSIIKASYTDSLLAEPVKELTARLRISPDSIVIDELSVQFVSSDFSASGKISDPFPYLLPVESLDRSRIKRPLFVFELTSNRFDTDRLFPEAVPGAGTEVEPGAVSLDSISPLLLPDIDGRGHFRIDTLVYARVELTEITGEVRLYDRMIDVYDARGMAYSGQVSGKTVIDLNDFENPHYSGSFEASQVEVDDFMSRFTPLGGHMKGKLRIEGSYEAAGWEPEAFLNSLTMNSKAGMHDGMVSTSGAVYSTISTLAEKIGNSFEKNQSLSDLVTGIVVADGKVSLDNLKSSVGNLGDLELGGWYGFDGSISYKGTVLLSEGTTAKLLSNSKLLGSLGGLLGENSMKRLRLPLLIGGTVNKPSVKLDYSVIADNLKKNVGEKATDLLKGLFKK